MYFPAIEECANRKVERIDAAKPLSHALEQMLQHDLRDVVVVTETGHLGLITVTDIIQARAQDSTLSLTIEQAGYRHLESVSEGTNLLDVLDRIEIDSGYLAVTDKAGALIGIVSTSDILSYLDPQVMIERQQIGSLLFKNQLRVLSVTASLEEALSQLEDISDAVVLWGGCKEQSGILTTKDAIQLIGRGLEGELPAIDFATRPLETVPPQMTIKEAVNYIKARHFHRLVIEEDGALLGIVTQQELITIAYSRWAELMRDHADELREVVSLLENRSAKLEHLASTDALTGLSNRSRFERILEAELERRHRYPGEPASLVLLDIDHFKQVNDRFGHDVGDEVLKRLVTEVNSRIRRVDTLARWGGEEFILLLPHTRLNEAFQVAEGIRLRLEGVEYPKVGQITASFGVVQLQADESGQEAFRRVDSALYKAKTQGRNSVFAEDE